MKNLIIAVLAVSMLGCGDDTKKAASTNVESNNTSTPNNTTTGNNTTSNNTTSNNTSANNTSANNITVDVPEFDLGNDNDPISSIDVANACEKTQAYFAANLSDAEVKEFGCLLTGAFTAAFGGDLATDSEVQMACADAYDACMAEPADPNPMETCDLAPTDCAADIGLVEQCIQGQVEGLKTIATTFTCADMTLDSDPDSEISITPSACDQLETECPDFFGAGE